MKLVHNNPWEHFSSLPPAACHRRQTWYCQLWIGHPERTHGVYFALLKSPIIVRWVQSALIWTIHDCMNPSADISSFRTAWISSMAVLLQAWVLNRSTSTSDTTSDWLLFQVDLGGSLAVASRGLFATGVSTDLNGECATTATFLAQNETLPRLANSLQKFFKSSDLPQLRR